MFFSGGCDLKQMMSRSRETLWSTSYLRGGGAPASSYPSTPILGLCHQLLLLIPQAHDGRAARATLPPTSRDPPAGQLEAGSSLSPFSQELLTTADSCQNSGQQQAGLCQAAERLRNLLLN